MQVLKKNYVHITETAVWQQISFKMASILQLPVFFLQYPPPLFFLAATTTIL